MDTYRARPYAADINEDCELRNGVCQPFIQIKPLAYSLYKFKYEYCEEGRCLEKSPSLWKEGEFEEQPEPGPSFKRRKVDKVVCSFLGQLDGDTLLHSLSLLDLRSLIRCMLVEKSLRRVILSAELRRLWSEQQPPVVLISSYTLPCKLWLPGTSRTTCTVFHPLRITSAMVVASHRGLVCIRFQRPLPEPLASGLCIPGAPGEALDLAVGNPLTGEWAALPQSHAFGEKTGITFRMEVEEPQHDRRPVGFRVAALCANLNNHICHFFDSARGVWSSSEVYYTRSTFKWSDFDLRSSSWRTHLVRDCNIRTGLERSPTEVHRLPHPYLHGFSRWEYKGSTYFASAWTVQQPTYGEVEDSAGEFAGYGVWKVVKHGESESSEHLETVAAVWGGDVGASLAAIRNNIWAWYSGCGVRCYTCDGLVWFEMESRYKPTMPVVFYDMATGRWTSFDEQHEAPDDKAGGHYAAAVVYSPTLLVAPARPPKTVQEEPREEEEVESDDD